jgi:hypothetical protein
MRIYPGVSLKKTYDHEKRPWYVSHDDQCMDSFTTTTFVVIRTDYRGSCKSAHTSGLIVACMQKYNNRYGNNSQLSINVILSLVMFADWLIG